MSWMMKLQFISSGKFTYSPVNSSDQASMNIFLPFVTFSSIQCNSFTLKTVIENLQSQRWDFWNARKDFDKLFASDCDEINAKYWNQIIRYRALEPAIWKHKPDPSHLSAVFSVKCTLYQVLANFGLLWMSVIKTFK